MEQSRKFFYSHSHYYDCPSCDGNGFGDIEFVHLSPTFDNKKDLLANILENTNSLHFGKLYSLDDWGEIQSLGDIIETTGFHSVRSVELTMDGFYYKYKQINYKWTLETNDEGYKRLYIDE